MIFTCTLFACTPEEKSVPTVFEVDYSLVKTQVYWGTELDLTGLNVRVKLSNGLYRTLAEGDDGYALDKGGYDAQTPGVYAITITFENFAAVSFEIEVLNLLHENDVEAYPVAINVKKNTGRRIFILNEAFDSEGLIVEVTYSDGSKKESTGFVIDNSAFDSETEGYYLIKVKLVLDEKEYNCNYAVSVVSEQ